MVVLEKISPKIFNGGLEACNEKGKKLITKKRVKKMLDLGCGVGDLTIEFAEIARAKEVYGVDLVDERLKEAAKQGIKFKKADLNDRFPFRPNTFDLVVSSQNIEHVHNTRRYVEESYKCLKKGGQFIVLTENLSSWANIAATILGWQPFSTTNVGGWYVGNPLIWHLDEKKDAKFHEKYRYFSGIVGHNRVLAYRGLKDLMENAGFKDVKVTSAGYFPVWGILSRILCRIDKRHGHFLAATGYK